MTLYALDGIAPEVPENGDYWVAPGAHVIGRVTLAEGVGIWFGCTLRGDTEPVSVGQGTNIQENTVVHTDPGYPAIIGANCTIGHKAMIHGCVIGDGTLIGMGATVLSGAKIGKGCLIGAGALVTEGKEIPDGSLVMGMPAKVVRTLDSDAQSRILGSAEVYLKRMRQYRKGLVALEGTSE